MKKILCRNIVIILIFRKYIPFKITCKIINLHLFHHPREHAEKKYLNMVSCCSFHLITIEAYSQQPNKKNSSPKFVLRVNQMAWLCQSYKIGYSKVESANPCTGWGQVYLRGREICYYWKNTMLTGMNLFLNHQWKQK